MDRQIDNYLDRPKQYFNIDGVGELGIGFMILGFGLLQWLQMSSSRSSIWNHVYTLFVFGGVMCAIIHYGTKAIKERITYPRTGYVEYRNTAKTRLGSVVLGFFTALLVAGMAIYAAVRQSIDFSAAPAFLGLVMVASYAYGFVRTVRWKWFVALILALGTVAIAMLPAPVVESVADRSWLTGMYPANVMGGHLLMLAFFGLTFLVSGGITFWLYLHNTRPQARETE